MTGCCGQSGGKRCKVCRAELRLVLGVVGMVVTMTLADEVRSQTSRRDPLTAARPMGRVAAPSRSPSAQPQRPRAVSIAVRPLDLSVLTSAAFADWPEPTR